MLVVISLPKKLPLGSKICVFAENWKVRNVPFYNKYHWVVTSNFYALSWISFKGRNDITKRQSTYSLQCKSIVHMAGQDVLAWWRCSKNRRRRVALSNHKLVRRIWALPSSTIYFSCLEQSRDKKSAVQKGLTHATQNVNDIWTWKILGVIQRQLVEEDGDWGPVRPTFNRVKQHLKNIQLGKQTSEKQQQQQTLHVNRVNRHKKTTEKLNI